MIARHKKFSERRKALTLAAVAVALNVMLGACTTPPPVAERQVRATVTGITANPVEGNQRVSGEIENGTASEVHAVVVRLGAYDNEDVRMRSLYTTAGPLPAGARARFTLSCQDPCTQVKVERIDTL